MKLVVFVCIGSGRIAELLRAEGSVSGNGRFCRHHEAEPSVPGANLMVQSGICEYYEVSQGSLTVRVKPCCESNDDVQRLEQHTFQPAE